MSKTFSNFVICGVLLLMVIHPTWSTPGSIGQPCKENKECLAISILLTCQSGKCACVNDADVKIDEERQQCVVIEESSCHREGPEFDNKFIYVPCIKSTICDSISKTCVCEEQYYSAGNGSCIEQKQYQQSCRFNSNITECDIFRLLICTPEGTCGCAPGMNYHEELKTCFQPIGSSCTRENYFHNPIFPGRYDSCPLQAECYGGICSCRPGFRVSSDGICHKEFGERCGTDEPCSDIQFACRNGMCKCKYPLHQVYDTEQRECLSIVPGPCEDSILHCVPNAHCVKGQCRCEERYRQNPDGKCIKKYGYDCEFDYECSKTLACINNQCSCPDFLQSFDRETESCLSLAGARCLLTFESFDGSRNSSCIDGAECVPFGSGPTFGDEGECLCLENWTKLDNGTCSQS